MKSNGKDSGGTIALLNLPAHAVLSLDGSASQTLKNEENLLVIDNIYPSHGCHLLVVRGNGDAGSHNGQVTSMLSIGILIMYPHQFMEESAGWFVAREFDARTEEISSRLIDELSQDNLKKSIINQHGMSGNHCKIIPYHQFISSSSNNIDVVWGKYLTNFISSTVLAIHGLTGRGDKIIPGSFTQDDDKTMSGINAIDTMDTYTDGETLRYPSIPHIDTHQNRSINSHSGTRRFLARLTPTERTSFFINSNSKGGGVLDNRNDSIFENVLLTYYKGNWEVMLGQFQLSFVVFLCCSCLSSLEHW